MKKKGRKTRSLYTEPRTEARSENGLLHFRLCHVCLYLNESTQEIAGCRKCGEAFSPNEDHEADEIHMVSPSDPFEDWDQDDSETPQTDGFAEEESESSVTNANNEPKLNGLRVRW